MCKVTIDVSINEKVGKTYNGIGCLSEEIRQNPYKRVYFCVLLFFMLAEYDNV